MAKKYIDADKLIEYLNKTMESYKSQMVDPTKFPIDHIDLMALLAREYQALILNIPSLQQEQPEVDLEKEIDDYIDSIDSWRFEEEPFTVISEIASHFAKWGAEHARNEE